MRAISFRFVLGAMVVVAVGCGKPTPGVVPVKSPIQRFVPPEAEEVFPEEEEATETAGTEGDGSFESDGE